MKLEKQVTSLKLSKKLKELGVKQESLWMWCIPEGGQDQDRFLSCVEDNTFCDQETCSFNHDYISAFTVAELGEMLPDYIKDIGNLDIGKNYTDHINMKKKLVKHRTWHISYWTWTTSFTSKHEDLYLKQIANPKIPLIHAKTEANARAKMLVYLRENKLISYLEGN